MRAGDFKAHPIWGGIKAQSHFLGQIDARFGPTYSGQLDGIRELQATIRGFEASEDYGLFSDAMLERVHDAWWRMSDRFYDFLKDPESGQAQFNAGIVESDTVREHLALWPRPQTSRGVKAALARTLNAYREELDASREEFESRLEQSLARAGEREKSLNGDLARLSELLAVSQANLAKFEGRIFDGESRMNSALVELNETFIAGQAAREQTFGDWLKERASAFDEMAEPHVASIVAASKEAKKGLDEVNGLRTSTVEMASLAAGDIMADEYRDHAKSERRASYIAYGVGIAAAAGSIAIVMFAFGSFGASVDWQRVVLKLGLTVAAGGVATVAFRFAGQAVRRATSFKRQELELRALQPFLKDVAGADKAKTAFLERAFGHSWVEGPAGKSEPELNDALLKLLTTAMQNAGKPGVSSGP